MQEMTFQFKSFHSSFSYFISSSRERDFSSPLLLQKIEFLTSFVAFLTQTLRHLPSRTLPRDKQRLRGRNKREKVGFDFTGDCLSDSGFGMEKILSKDEDANLLSSFLLCYLSLSLSIPTLVSDCVKFLFETRTTSYVLY